uniref:Protein kinase n=1 Tax=Stigmatella aurantiaca TaxID=41 RepID=Q8RJZ3_STIAU|nr:protein kinase [Stigmatella aurantiaca Sg a15]
MEELISEALPDGSRVGPWRIEGRAGYGTYGAVYRAHRVGRICPRSVALKLARYPNDLRFEREAELLERVRHANVPRLLGHGTWRAGPQGEAHPYVVMQWVEGVRLYQWNKERLRTAREVLRVLAQVARALEATHMRGGLHRDVKGENVLVSPEGHASLMDFGCGTWEGAAPLTGGILAPGTKAYRSPEALRFHWNHRNEADAHYQATPADDVYALGVTAYRLCTGIYPPPATEPSGVGEDERETQEVKKPPSQVRPLVPALEQLILRMLRDNPKERGRAGELAAEMEALAERAGAEADEPMNPNHSSVPSEITGRPVSVQREWGGWPVALVLVAVGLLLWGSGSLNTGRRVAPASRMTEGGTGGVADAAVEALPVSSAAREPEPSGLNLDMLKEPLPGQRRPPCPRFQISIQGGCWLEVPQSSPPCGESYYEWKGACYSPVAAPPRPRTSDPQ